MEERVILEVKNLTIGYGKGGSAIKVVENISFALNSGEFILMLGCNGAGKSTLLRTLSAVQPPLAGEVKVCGESLMEISNNFEEN